MRADSQPLHRCETLTAVIADHASRAQSPGFVACLVGIEVASMHLRLRVELCLVPLCEAALPPTRLQVINHCRAVGT